MGGGGGVNILSIYYCIIYWPPPPPTNIRKRFFANGIQWQLSFNTQNIYISLTKLFHGWHFFYGRGGGGSKYYGIINWPTPLQNIQEQYFVNEIQWQLSFKTQYIYISLTILFHGWQFFLMGGGGSIYYGVIYWPPPPKNIQEQYFVNGIQWLLSFKTQNIYISLAILLGGWHFFLMVCGGGQYIMV